MKHYLFPAWFVVTLICLGVYVRLLFLWRKSRREAPTTGQNLTFRRGFPPSLRIALGCLAILGAFLFGYVGPGMAKIQWDLFHILALALLLIGSVGIYSGWRVSRKRGKATLTLDTPAVLGETLGGVLHFPFPLKEEEGEVTLLHQQVQVWVAGKGEQYLGEEPVWEKTQKVIPRVSPEGTDIPFLFPLPPDQHPSTKGKTRWEWVLVFRHPEIGEEKVAVEVRGLEETPSVAPPQPPFAPILYPKGPQAPRLVQLFAHLFLLFAPLGAWFILDAAQKPWLHLESALPKLLFQGLFFALPFGTALFFFLRTFPSETDWGRVGRKAFLPFLVGTLGILSYGGYRLFQLSQTLAWEKIIDKLMDGFIHSLLGTFLGLGILGIVLALRNRKRKPT